MAEKHVIVTFHLEADDASHETGVTEETYEFVTAAISEAGGYDVNFELVED